MNLTIHLAINLYVKDGENKTNYSCQNFNITSTCFHIFQQTFYGNACHVVCCTKYSVSFSKLNSDDEFLT